MRARLDLLRGMVTQIFTSWNRIAAWLRQIEVLRRAA